MTVTSKRRRIAIIGCKGLPAFHGIDCAVEGYLGHLTEQYDFTVYCSAEYTQRTSGPYDGYRMIVLKKIPNRRLNTLWYYIKAALLATFVHSYDMVHIHHSDSAFLLPLLRLRYGRRVLVTTHGAFTPLNDKWKRFALFFWFQTHIFLRFAGHLTSVSRNEVREIKRVLGRDSIYTPNGIQISRAVSDADVGSQYLLFAAGRIMHLKGLDLLLKILPQFPDESLKILGDISHAPTEYKEEINRLSSGLAAEYVGMIKDKSLLYRYMQCGKIFVFPSRAETMSIQLLEAVACETPVICSDIVANRDIFTDEEVLFFRSGDETDLAEKLRFALAHPEEMKRRAANALKLLNAEYTLDKIAANYQRVYENILG